MTGKGDYDAALAILNEGVVLSEKVGDEVQRHRLLNCLGWLHIELGDLDRGLDLNRVAAELARKRGDPETISNAEINLGDIFLLQGDLVLAQEFLEEVHRRVKDPATSDWMRWRYSTHLFSSLGELRLAQGDAAQAQDFANQCVDIATRTNSRRYLVRGRRLKGEIALRQHRWDDAEGALRQALDLALAIGNPTQLWKTHLALGRLWTERKQPGAAQAACQAARAVVDQIRGSLRAPQLRDSLDKSPLFREVDVRAAL